MAAFFSSLKGGQAQRGPPIGTWCLASVALASITTSQTNIMCCRPWDFGYGCGPCVNLRKAPLIGGVHSAPHIWIAACPRVSAMRRISFGGIKPENLFGQATPSKLHFHSYTSCHGCSRMNRFWSNLVAHVWQRSLHSRPWRISLGLLALGWLWGHIRLQASNLFRSGTSARIGSSSRSHTQIRLWGKSLKGWPHCRPTRKRGGGSTMGWRTRWSSRKCTHILFASWWQQSVSVGCIILSVVAWLESSCWMCTTYIYIHVNIFIYIYKYTIYWSIIPMCLLMISSHNDDEFWLHRHPLLGSCRRSFFVCFAIFVQLEVG